MSDDPTTTASNTLRATSILIAAGLLPMERAVQTATAFDQLATIGGDLPLMVADLVAGLAIVANSRLPVEPDRIMQRRTTCAQIVGLLIVKHGDELYGRDIGGRLFHSAQTFRECGQPMRLAAVLRAFAGHLETSTDQVHIATRETAVREASEIEEECGG